MWGAEMLLCPGNASSHEAALFPPQPRLPTDRPPVVEAVAERGLGRAAGARLSALGCSCRRLAESPLTRVPCRKARQQKCFLEDEL